MVPGSGAVPGPPGPKTVPRADGAVARQSSTPVNQNLALDIPTPMDGTWTLAFDLDPSGRTLNGKAKLTLANGVEHEFLVRGRTGAHDTAVLTLSGDPADPASAAISIRTTFTPLEGSWARLESFAGRGYGQTVGR